MQVCTNDHAPPTAEVMALTAFFAHVGMPKFRSFAHPIIFDGNEPKSFSVFLTNCKIKWIFYQKIDIRKKIDTKLKKVKGK